MGEDGDYRTKEPGRDSRRFVEARQRPWLAYGATAAVTCVGMTLWLALPRLESAWSQPAGLSVSRVGLLLTLMLGTIAFTTIRLNHVNERWRERLCRTKEHLAEVDQRVQEANERLRMMFSANPSPMWIYDRATLRFLEVNDAAVRQYGYSRDEFLRMTIKDIRPPAEVPALVNDIDQFDWGHNPRGIWRHRRKDGSLLSAEITAFKYQKNGDVQYIVLASDVTKRAEAEAELRKSQTLLQSLIDNAPLGICRGSIDGDRCLAVNAAFCEMLGGYTPQELMALRLSTQLYAEPKDRARLLELLQRNRKIAGFETTLRRRDGSLLRVRISGVLTHGGDENENFFEGYVEDLTHQSSLEQQIRQVQKLEAVGRLAGGVAHDFNNILVVIKLSTELMLSQVTPESPLTKSLLQVSHATDRASALTRQMLAFGRQQMMQVRTLNLNSVVADISHMLRRIIGEDVCLVTTLSETLANSRLDADQVGQVLLNLAVNARDAMPHGGTLQIETQNVTLDGTYTKEHPPVVAGRYVMLAVSDTGTGIEKSALPHIFDPFFTTKEVGKGTGLGLSIVYGIVKQSGGNIWVYSEPGHGTTFKLYFPAIDAIPDAPDNPQCTLQAGGQTLLLVDDDAVIRSKVRECLEQLGYRVHQAESAEAALVVCHKLQGAIDLLITDLVMPGMGGHDLATLLTERYPKLRVLFMSGYTEDNAARRAIMMKGSLFLQKPFSVADLSSALQQAFEPLAVSTLA